MKSAQVFFTVNDIKVPCCLSCFVLLTLSNTTAAQYSSPYGNTFPDFVASLSSSEVTKDTEELEFIKNKLVEEILAPLLSHCDIDYYTPLMAQGLTSHGVSGIASGIYKVFGIEVQNTVIFDYPTVQYLAEHLCKLSNGCSTTNDGVLSLKSSTMAARDVAITGLACRLPNGIEGSNSLWGAISTGRCMIRKVRFTPVHTTFLASPFKNDHILRIHQIWDRQQHRIS